MRVPVKPLPEIFQRVLLCRFGLNISLPTTSKRPDRTLSQEVEMGRRWRALTLGALTIVNASLARADDVGCCEAACRTTDASGAAMGTVTRSDLTEADCESRFPGCDITWHSGTCGGVGGEMGIVRHGEPEER